MEKRLYEIYVSDDDARFLPFKDKVKNGIFKLAQSPPLPVAKPAAVFKTAEEALEQKKNYTKAIRLDGLNVSGEGAIVAVLDTGVDFHHPDLVDAEWRNVGEIPDNNIDDDQNGFVDDVNGWNFHDGNGDTLDQLFSNHGTAVAGIISGKVTGVAPGSKVMAIKVTDGRSGDWGTLLAAMAYASKMGAHAVNLSLSGTSWPLDMTTLFHEAMGENVFYAVAAGNSSKSCDEQKFYPSALTFPNMISVIASGVGENSFVKAKYSNYGNCYELAAPAGEGGYGIVTTSLTFPDLPYRIFDGTSAATPIVIGTAALLKAAHPNLSAEKIKELILQNATIKNDLEVSQGRFLNIESALNTANVTEQNPTSLAKYGTAAAHF
ncbi:MAG: S8 family serine peptidase [Bdellovibrionota bacterium]